MSLVSAFLILLLCLSMHASHARHFLSFSQDSPTKFQLLQEVKENITPSTNPAEENVNKNIERKEETDSKELFSEAKESATTRIKSSGHVPIKPLVSVSWRVPGRSSGHDKHPGFHSDYSQPRTRNEIPKFSSIAVSIKATDKQVSTRQARSLVGFGSDFKKVPDYKKSKLQDDDVEQEEDYDPPHGTPPIHNRKT